MSLKTIVTLSVILFTVLSIFFLIQHELHIAKTKLPAEKHLLLRASKGGMHRNIHGLIQDPLDKKSDDGSRQEEATGTVEVESVAGEIENIQQNDVGEEPAAVLKSHTKEGDFISY